MLEISRTRPPRTMTTITRVRRTSRDPFEVDTCCAPPARARDEHSGRSHEQPPRAVGHRSSFVLPAEQKVPGVGRRGCRAANAVRHRRRETLSHRCCQEPAEQLRAAVDAHHRSRQSGARSSYGSSSCSAGSSQRKAGVNRGDDGSSRSGDAGGGILGCNGGHHDCVAHIERAPQRPDRNQPSGRR